MSKIFISYRRDDSSTVAGRIYDRLASHFGRGAVFKDVDSIPLGVNFAQYIDGVIQQCAVTLVIIGPHWASALNRERLADPGDFVRQEVEAALNRKIPVIPVFVQGAAMPSNSDLPPSLNELVMRNGLPVRDDPDFDNDIRRVMTALERYVPPMRPSYSVAGPAYTATAPARPGTPAASGPTSYAPRTATAVQAPPRAPRKPASTKQKALTAGIVAVSILVLVGLLFAAFRMLGNAANDPTIQAHSFKALAMNADGTEGWAVGDEQVAHYAHGAWSRISTPAFGLETVAMVPGTNEAYAGGTASGLYHYDGTSWSEVPGSSAWRQIGAIVFTGSNSGWATYLESIGSAGFLRFANGRWQPDSTAPQTKAPFTHFSMLSSGDGWAIQSGDMPVHIAAGGTWKQFTDSWLEGYNSVAMVSPTDVWLVGTNALAGGDGLILHMLEDSKGWYTDDPNSLNVPDPDIKSATKSFGGNGFNDVSFSPSDHSTAWAVGQNGLVAQWTATSKTWTEQDSGTNDYLSAVYAVSPTEAWAVGGGPFFEQDSAVILHYKDGAWNPVVSKA